MIAAMVGAFLLLMLGLAVLWFASPAFRAWAERPKFQMLEREAMYERAEADNPNLAKTANSLERRTATRKGTRWPDHQHQQ